MKSIVGVLHSCVKWGISVFDFYRLIIVPRSRVRAIPTIDFNTPEQNIIPTNVRPDRFSEQINYRLVPPRNFHHSVAAAAVAG